MSNRISYVVSCSQPLNFLLPVTRASSSSWVSQVFGRMSLARGLKDMGSQKPRDPRPKLLLNLMGLKLYKSSLGSRGHRVLNTLRLELRPLHICAFEFYASELSTFTQSCSRTRCFQTPLDLISFLHYFDFLHS